MIHNSSQKRTMTYHTVISYACCLPPTVVATGITLIQLVAIVFVPAHVQNGYTKWSQTCRHGQNLLHGRVHKLASVLVNTIFWLAPQAGMMNSISFEGSFSCSFFNKFQAVFPTRVTNKLFRQKISRNSNPVLWKKEQFYKHNLEVGGLQEQCHWLPQFAWVLGWLHFFPCPAL